MNPDLLTFPDRAALRSDARLQAYSGKRALVTGGLGFIPSNLVHALHALGCSVTAIDSLAPDQGGNRFNLSGIEDEVDVRIAARGLGDLQLYNGAMHQALLAQPNFVRALLDKSARPLHSGDVLDEVRDPAELPEVVVSAAK